MDETGKLTPLTRKNVDTGAGLERLSMIMQEKDNTFETDLLYPILQEVVRVSGVPYRDGDPLKDSYLKIIADHVRSVTFLVNDGVKVGNVGRDYVLRFLIRRGQRFGKLLGLSRPFLHTLIRASWIFTASTIQSCATRCRTSSNWSDKRNFASSSS